MDEVLAYLRANGVFYLATIDGTVPRIRPFGFVMIYKDKLTFSTNEEKEVYEQLLTNPHFEVCSFNAADDTWIRVRGKAVFLSKEESMEATELYKAVRSSIVYEDGDIIFQMCDGVAEFHDGDPDGEMKVLMLS